MADSNQKTSLSPEALNQLAGHLSKVVCVGRNYAAHAVELNNPVPDTPVLFIKPSTAVVNWTRQVAIPSDRGECHHELELALLVGERLSKADRQACSKAIVAVTLALDLTLRDQQSQLKQQGKPWELAKAFDGACPIGPWQVIQPNEDDSDASSIDGFEIELKVNGQIRQAGGVKDMIWHPFDLISQISQYFTLNPGDVVLTGTPAGVAALHKGDQLIAALNGKKLLESEVVYAR